MPTPLVVCSIDAVPLGWCTTPLPLPRTFSMVKAKLPACSTEAAGASALCGFPVAVKQSDALPATQTVAHTTAPALFFHTRFDHGLLDAVDGEGGGAVVEIAAGVGDVGPAGEAEGVQGQVAEGGQVAGYRTGPELGVILAEGDVSGPMETVSNGPVSSRIAVQVVRAGVVGVEADDAVDDLFAGAHTVETAGVTA
jgi:hypothetical protein